MRTPLQLIRSAFAAPDLEAQRATEGDFGSFEFYTTRLTGHGYRGIPSAWMFAVLGASNRPGRAVQPGVIETAQEIVHRTKPNQSTPLHHHLLPVTSTQPSSARLRKVSVMANAVDVLAWAERWQVELVLHGHEHQPSVTRARRWPTDTGDMYKPVVVAGAGSVGLRRDLGPFARNHYFVMIRTADELIVRSRMIGDGGLAWASHADLVIPCTREPGHEIGPN